jgi:hypothetical protein
MFIRLTSCPSKIAAALLTQSAAPTKSLSPDTPDEVGADIIEDNYSPWGREMGTAMGIFHRKVPSHLVPVHAVNATSKDWVVLLEAGTIVGPSTERLRVARSTLEKKIVKRYDLLLRAKHFLVVEGYDPRIHAVYFCPQLYKYDADKKLVPLQGEEIGRLIAHAVEAGIRERRPWYEPSEDLPDQPVISTPMQTEFDTLVVQMPEARKA